MARLEGEAEEERVTKEKQRWRRNGGRDSRKGEEEQGGTYFFSPVSLLVLLVLVTVLHEKMQWPGDNVEFTERGRMEVPHSEVPNATKTGWYVKSSDG